MKRRRVRRPIYDSLVLHWINSPIEICTLVLKYVPYSTELLCNVAICYMEVEKTKHGAVIDFFSGHKISRKVESLLPGITNDAHLERAKWIKEVMDDACKEHYLSTVYTMGYTASVTMNDDPLAFGPSFKSDYFGNPPKKAPASQCPRHDKLHELYKKMGEAMSAKCPDPVCVDGVTCLVQPHCVVGPSIKNVGCCSVSLSGQSALFPVEENDVPRGLYPDNSRLICWHEERGHTTSIRIYSPQGLEEEFPWDKDESIYNIAFMGKDHFLIDGNLGVYVVSKVLAKDEIEE